MINVICALIAATATIVCAWIAGTSAKADKVRQINDERSEARAKERAKEARLQLAMIAANSKLTVGVAMALKNGHTNGEVEEGLAAVDNANNDYTRFLEEIALDHIKD